MALSWWQRLVMKRMARAAWRARFGGRRPLPLTIERLEPRCLPSIVPTLSGSTVTFDYNSSPVPGNIDVYLRSTPAGILEWSEALGGPYSQDLDPIAGGIQSLNVQPGATINVPLIDGPGAFVGTTYIGDISGDTGSLNFNFGGPATVQGTVSTTGSGNVQMKLLNVSAFTTPTSLTLTVGNGAAIDAGGNVSLSATNANIVRTSVGSVPEVGIRLTGAQ